MIYAFDMDGTIVEAWYGKDTPEFYSGEADMATRGSSSDLYEYVKPLPYIVPFLRAARNLDQDAKFVIVSRIVSGHEYLSKLNFIKKNFLDDDGKPFFAQDDLFGTTSDADKLHVLELLAEKDDVIYFDDTLSTLSNITTAQKEKDKFSKHILCVHATSLATKRPAEIQNAYMVYNESFLKDFT